MSMKPKPPTAALPETLTAERVAYTECGVRREDGLRTKGLKTTAGVDDSGLGRRVAFCAAANCATVGSPSTIVTLLRVPSVRSVTPGEQWPMPAKNVDDLRRPRRIERPHRLVLSSTKFT